MKTFAAFIVSVMVLGMASLCVARPVPADTIARGVMPPSLDIGAHVADCSDTPVGISRLEATAVPGVDVPMNRWVGLELLYISTIGALDSQSFKRVLSFERFEFHG